jgi:pimeloyl-ACP methyl ester carboxylesterase
MRQEIEGQLIQFLARLSMNWHQPLYVDGMSVGTNFRYVEVEVDPSLRKDIPILLQTGWGSGWEGILPLAFRLACLGYRVVLVSLPGYGKSQNPPPRYWKESLFNHHASVVIKVLRKFGIQKAYFVGHSMGAEVLAEAARMCPWLCEKLMLLHPSGVEKVGFFGKFALLLRFASSGARLRREYFRSPKSQNDELKVLIDICGKQNSPWRGRLRLRWAEFKEICRGGLLDTLKRVPSPVIFLSGSRDTVYSAWRCFELIYMAIPEKKIRWSILPENLHNPTLFHAEETAKMIDDLLS